MMKKRLQIGTELVQVHLYEAQSERNQGLILAQCPISTMRRGFVATEHQQNYWANEVNYLLLSKPGATLSDVSNFLGQDLQEVPPHLIGGVT